MIKYQLKKMFQFIFFTIVWKIKLSEVRYVHTTSTTQYRLGVRYRGFHEKGTFSVHSFNDDYLSIPERPGSYKYLFHEIPVMSMRATLYSFQDGDDEADIVVGTPSSFRRILATSQNLHKLCYNTKRTNNY